MEGKTPSINAGAHAYIAIRTPVDGKYAHFRPDVFSTTANMVEVNVYEGQTITGGNPYAPRNQNRNRQTSNPSSSLCYTTPTFTRIDGELIVGPYIIGIGGGPQTRSGGSSNGAENEIVWKPDTWYLYRFTNIGAATATVVYFNLFWYEEGRG